MLSRFKNTIKQFKIKYSMQYQLTLECTRKFIPPPWYKKWDGGGGGMETLPRVFDRLQYFETILPSVKSH